jgi:hypothetical protein
VMPGSVMPGSPREITRAPDPLERAATAEASCQGPWRS